MCITIQWIVRRLHMLPTIHLLKANANIYLSMKLYKLYIGIALIFISISLKRSRNCLFAYFLLPEINPRCYSSLWVRFSLLCVQMKELPILLRLLLRYSQRMLSYSTIYTLPNYLLWNCLLFCLPATELCWGRPTSSPCRWPVCAYC